MPESPKDKAPKEFKRANRTVGVGEAVSHLLEPAFKRRGFASRDIITHWHAMAPEPYGALAMPDKLSWPRGERGAVGATLYLRCVEGQQLALTHEAPRIAAAVNRYFGYLLVAEVRLSITPFSPGSAAVSKTPPVADPLRRAVVGHAVGKVEDVKLREALRELGLRLATHRR